MSGPGDDPDRLFDLARAGAERPLGRLVSLVEGGGAAARRVAELVASSSGAAVGTDEGFRPRGPHVIGLTGPPGAGKSTATAALVGSYRAAGRRVAVVAVDPSSPYSGGAVLGDRIRMQRHALDRSVFIRSLASRGQLGGLSAAVPGVLALLGACGFDVVLIETVGVGQAEVEVASHADTVVVVVPPGFGDSVQLAKAGILEIADVIVVSKADLDGAVALRDDVRRALELAAPSSGAPVPAVLLLAAARNEGVAELVAELDAHLASSLASGALQARRRRSVAARIEAICRELLATRYAASAGTFGLDALAGKVLDGELDAYSAAEIVLGT